MSEAPLPKQELLIKIMGMTTASNDGEALAAMRRANALLVGAGWDWEKLIRGKITVVEDPFKAIQDPGFRNTAPTRTVPDRPNTPAAEPDWAPIFNPAPLRPTPAAPPRMATTIRGISTNRFPGWCWHCAREVIAGSGKIFKPLDHNSNAGGLSSSGFEVVCSSCDGRHVCNSRRAIVTKTRKKSVGDLA